MLKLIYTVLLLFIQHGYSEGKVDVEVLFETLCPDSLNFITKQLYPTWKQLAPYINLKFVPFGKSASSDNGSTFVCQHGPQECIGNRVTSCGLKTTQDQNLQVEFVKCILDVFKRRRRNNLEYGQSCATKLGLNWEYISHCHDTQEGTVLQLQAEHETKRYKPRFIPTIVFNGKFDQQVQDASLYNFKEVACSFIRDTYSSVC